MGYGSPKCVKNTNINNRNKIRLNFGLILTVERFNNVCPFLMSKTFISLQNSIEELYVCSSFCVGAQGPTLLIIQSIFRSSLNILETVHVSASTFLVMLRLDFSML